MTIADAHDGPELTKKGEAYCAAASQAPENSPQTSFETLPLPDEPMSGRARLEAALELLADLRQEIIDQLDLADGDPDFEDGADAEPMLGAPENSCQLTQEHLWGERRDILRRGRRVRHGDQTEWAAGGDVGDREDVSEDEGAQCDDEGVRDNEDGCAIEDASGEGALGWSESESLSGRLTFQTGDGEAPKHPHELAGLSSVVLLACENVSQAVEHDQGRL